MDHGGNPELALPILRRALAIYEVKAPGTPGEWAMAHHELGEAARRLGRHAEALEHERQAIRCIEAKIGADSDYLLFPLQTIGALYLDQGRPDLAISPLERAAGIYERQPPAFLRWSAETRFLLARALWEADRDRPRALDLARRAHERLQEDARERPDRARRFESLAHPSRRLKGTCMTEFSPGFLLKILAADGTSVRRFHLAPGEHLVGSSPRRRSASRRPASPAGTPASTCWRTAARWSAISAPRTALSWAAGGSARRPSAASP